MQAMWEVLYKDGSTLEQYDRNSPHFVLCEGAITEGEVPFKAIDWPNVTELRLFNAETGMGQSYDIAQPPEGYQLSLRMRTFSGPGGDATVCFILLTSETGKPITKDTVVKAFYWFPDFTTHWCTEFNCGAVGQWALNQRLGRIGDLPQTHDQLKVAVDALLQ